jgi:tetratricopeptide (TPR) repeat protein
MSLDSSYQVGQTVGTKLRAARQARKYTQSRLAQPDFSVSYISAIERGQIQPSLRALEILAQRLGVSTAELLPRPEHLAVELSQAFGKSVVSGEERDLLLLEAQISLHQGKPENAFRALQALRAHKGSKEQELEVAHLSGWAYLKNGQLEESEQILASAARLARELGDTRYPLILHLQGTVYTALHNTAQALQAQQESLVLLERQPADTRDIFLLARVYSSLGQYYSYFGQFESALKMFQQALKTLPAWTAYQDLEATYKGLACNQHEKAESFLETLSDYKWFVVSFRASLPSLRSEIQHLLGRALLKSQPEEATRYLLRLSQEASARQDPLSQASANIHLASVLLAQGKRSEAEFYTREVLEMASSSGATMIHADALLLQGELAYARQDYISGDQHFEYGLAMLEKLNASEELVEQLARYASLLEANGSIHKAIVYWKQAYKYKQKN